MPLNANFCPRFLPHTLIPFTNCPSQKILTAILALSATIIVVSLSYIMFSIYSKTRSALYYDVKHSFLFLGEVRCVLEWLGSNNGFVIIR